jgi:hypothetical protein
MAYSLIRQVNSEQKLIDHWTFGGGTALMLQIDHRESRDVDIFLRDPQLLALLDPQKRDFQFEIPPSDCTGDGARFLKLAFEGIGEIDFIVANAMTASPTKQDTIEGETVLLDAIPEIITKKIHYRGSRIKPRDIFDIAAAGEQHAAAIVKELKPRRDQVALALATIERLKPDFVYGAIAQLPIKDRYAAIAKTSLERAKRILQAV